MPCAALYDLRQITSRYVIESRLPFRALTEVMTVTGERPDGQRAGASSPAIHSLRPRKQHESLPDKDLPSHRSPAPAHDAGPSDQRELSLAAETDSALTRRDTGANARWPD